MERLDNFALILDVCGYITFSEAFGGCCKGGRLRLEDWCFTITPLLACTFDDAMRHEK